MSHSFTEIKHYAKASNKITIAKVWKMQDLPVDVVGVDVFK